ncbi:hypothetical protein PM082_024033 [Marasmius tenuissimus]|nr:hypothetical protein PM082_024033 [Marasmius tenuissimus]
MEPRSLFIPFFWGLTLLHSFIQVIIRATAMRVQERAPPNILPLHAQDLVRMTDSHLHLLCPRLLRRMILPEQIKR